MEIHIFRIISPLTSLNSSRLFDGAPRRLELILKMEAASSSDTSVTVCQSALSPIREGLSIRQHCCENIKSRN